MGISNKKNHRILIKFSGPRQGCLLVARVALGEVGSVMGPDVHRSWVILPVLDVDHIGTSVLMGQFPRVIGNITMDAKL